MAGDLQSFAVARANAVVSRTTPITDFGFLDSWFDRARNRRSDITDGLRFPEAPTGEIKGRVREIRASILHARTYVHETFTLHANGRGEAWPITRAYAGYYYSIEQALALDSLRATLPVAADERSVALCALIAAASQCSASPGHTAQPLGTKASSLPHVISAWDRDVFGYVRAEAESVAPLSARVPGLARVASWENMMGTLAPGDVVFCDPPYSDVQYSRFYHVLETLCRGIEISVFGSGRNPPFAERPASEFSRKSKAKDEAKKLIELGAKLRLKLVITFPQDLQSNGLDAKTFTAIARNAFRNVDSYAVTSVFSSLGGNGGNGSRPAREERIEEIILCQ